VPSATYQRAFGLLLALTLSVALPPEFLSALRKTKPALVALRCMAASRLAGLALACANALPAATARSDRGAPEIRAAPQQRP